MTWLYRFRVLCWSRLATWAETQCRRSYNQLVDKETR